MLRRVDNVDFCLANECMREIVKLDAFEKYKSTTGLVVEDAVYPLNYVLVACWKKSPSQCVYQKLQVANRAQKHALLLMVHSFANVIYEEDFASNTGVKQAPILSFAQMTAILLLTS